MTDEPIDLDKIRRDCRQTTWLIHADQALVPLTTARRHALDLCDEIERLRERGIRYDDAIEKLRGDWAGERDKVLALQARIDAALALREKVFEVISGTVYPLDVVRWDRVVQALTVEAS